jgi:hypothetical protein
MKDIALFAILIKQQGNPSVAIGVVFYCCDSGWNIVLVALEINNAIQLLVTAAAPAASYDTAVIATLVTMYVHHQRFLWR